MHAGKNIVCMNNPSNIQCSSHALGMEYSNPYIFGIQIAVRKDVAGGRKSAAIEVLTRDRPTYALLQTFSLWCLHAKLCANKQLNVQLSRSFHCIQYTVATAIPVH